MGFSLQTYYQKSKYFYRGNTFPNTYKVFFENYDVIKNLKMNSNDAKEFIQQQIHLLTTKLNAQCLMNFGSSLKKISIPHGWSLQPKVFNSLVLSALIEISHNFEAL